MKSFIENYQKESDDDLEPEALPLLASLLNFTKFFFKLRTGKEFIISKPVGRQPREIIISHHLTQSVNTVSEDNLYIINIPPRYGKTEFMIHYVAWALARYPDSNFIYTSVSKPLAVRQTTTIREIMSLPEYQYLFKVKLSKDTNTKEYFKTTDNGSVVALGAEGTIVGLGAGIEHVNRFGGAIIIDDIHKPAEAPSDVIRTKQNQWFLNTLQSRTNSSTTPIFMVGQVVHEDDLSNNLAKGFDGRPWKRILMPALDEAGNALDPKKHTKERLLKMQKVMPYDFAAQYQQNAQPAGGGLFKPEWFPIHQFDPHMLATFITVDTAETDKNYNDATVFSFFGIYLIDDNQDDRIYGLHWLDCLETRIEPFELEQTLYDFYYQCRRYPVKPRTIAIEKKSTGTSLVSKIKSAQGLKIIAMDRSIADGTKMSRFIKMQPYVAEKLISFPSYGKHNNFVIEHMRKITPNNSHRFDDIADTLEMGIQLALIDKSISFNDNVLSKDKVVSLMAKDYNQRISAMNGSNPWFK